MRRRSIVSALMMLLLVMGAPFAAVAVEVGENAPPFEGASTMGDIRLADYIGKQHVVLALYFAVFTPV